MNLSYWCLETVLFVILIHCSGLTLIMEAQSPSPSSSEPLSISVAREIAAHDGVDPTELSPPLFHSLDPAALDELFEPTSTDEPRTGRVTFTYDGKQVTVASDGEIEIESDPQPEHQPPQ